MADQIDSKHKKYAASLQFDFLIETPRPTTPRVTTNDGRSPGSRVSALSRLPGFPQWRFGSKARRLQLRGQLWLRLQSELTTFPFDPFREPSMIENALPNVWSIV